jgi:hypothetical protein
MLNLDTKTRDQIVQILQIQVVPAHVGHILVQVANILANLKEVEKPKDDVTPTAV